MSEEKLKCGEIFRVNEGKYIFICFHCGDEFQSSSKIVKHIDTHFQWNQPLPFAAAFDLSVNVKKEIEEEDIIFEDEQVTVADFLTTKLEKIEEIEQDKKQEIPSHKNDDDDEDSDYWPGDLFDLAGDDIAANESDAKPEVVVAVKNPKKKITRKQPKRPWIPRKKTSTYICEPCGAMYEYKNDMRLHILDNHAKKIKTLECDVCGSKFKSRFSLKKHLRRHRPEDYTVSEPLFCKYCDRKFPFLDTYEKHTAAHEVALNKTNSSVVSTSEVKVKIEKSNEKKSPAGKKRRPRPKLPPNQPPKAICSQCGKGFKTKCALKKHFYIHTGERPYVCEVCNKAYYTNSYLKIHRRIHTGKKEIIKYFKLNNNNCNNFFFLVGEKPYQCSQCGKKFVAANVLNEHLKWHNNSRPYKCNQCPKTFLLLENLKRHEPKHNQIRPVCSICNKSFSLDRTYRQHMLLHEGIGKHKCHYCDASFSSSTSRQKHEHVMHRLNDTFVSQTQLSLMTPPQQQPHQQPLHPSTGYFH